MKKIIFYTFTVLLLLNCNAQSNVVNGSALSEAIMQQGKPKLVVGIVVDQMRYDYLTRFDSKYGIWKALPQ